MSQNPNRPKKHDAVLGGRATPPIGGVVLGGIEGAKQRFNSPVVKARIAALTEALNYGEAGLDLVVRALQDESKQVRRQAYLLLRQRKEPQVVRALQEYKAWNLFERFDLPVRNGWLDSIKTFANRKVEDFDPETGIVDPAGTAYALRYEDSEDEEITNKLGRLLQDPQASKLEALVIGWFIYFPDSRNRSRIIIDKLVAAKEKLASIKALFIGDICYDCYIYRMSQSDISPILEAYPKLEMLQVRGGDGLAFSPTWHDNLEILVIESSGLNRETIADICLMDLPALAHLELWLGHYYGGGTSCLEDLMPILAGNLFPNLTYLGLRNSEYSDKIAAALVKAPVTQQIAVLDLSMGSLGNKSALALLDCPAINNLKILNISDNYLSEYTIKQLQQLDVQVITDNQRKERNRVHSGRTRYCSVNCVTPY